MMATVRSSGATTPFLVQQQQQPKLDTQMFAVYLANSVRRDVLHLAALGAIKESDKNAIFSYLPRSIVGIDDEDTLYKAPSTPASAYTKSTSKSTTTEPTRAIATPRRTPRQRSETAPQQQIRATLVPNSPTRRDNKAQKFEGLGAKLGALFGKFNVDETGRRTASSPRSPKPHQQLGLTTTLASLAEEEAKQMRETDDAFFRKASQGSRRSEKSNDSATIAEYSSDEGSGNVSQGSVSSLESIKASKVWQEINEAISGDSSAASSATSTLATVRKRSYTHLGVAMEAFAKSSIKTNQVTPQLRRARPVGDLSSQAKYSGVMTQGATHSAAAAASSLGLVLQQPPKPLPTPMRGQRHHPNYAGAKSPRSPPGSRSGSVSNGSVVAHAKLVSPTSPKESVDFPPMPSEASQAALSKSMVYMPHVPECHSAPPAAMNKSLPSLPQKKQKHVFATAIYDYHPQVSGDLRFSAGDRVLVKERINDDWWAGEVVTIGEDSVQDGFTGMFPRSHVHVESW